MCRPATEGGRRCAAHQGQARRDADRGRYATRVIGERIQVVNGMRAKGCEAGLTISQMHKVIFEKPAPAGLTEQQLDAVVEATEWTAPEVTKIRHRLADVLVEMCWRVKHKARSIRWMLEDRGLHGRVREAVIETQPVTPVQLADALDDPHPGVRRIAASRLTSQTRIAHLAEHGELHVQRGLVTNPNTPDGVLTKMAERTFELDEDGNEVNANGLDLVRNAAANELVRRGVTEPGRARAVPTRDLAGNLR